MPFLGFRERLALRRQVAAAIDSGQLSSDAAVVLYNSDAFDALQEQIANVHAASGGSHPILAWIVANLPAIINLVLKLLPLFGVNVPPITIPPLGSPTTTTAAPAGSVINPTQPGAAGMPTDFMIPPTWIPVIEQVVAQAVNALLPMIEAKVEGWVKQHAKAA